MIRGCVPAINGGKACKKFEIEKNEEKELGRGFRKWGVAVVGIGRQGEVGCGNISSSFFICSTRLQVASSAEGAAMPLMQCP